MKEGVTKIRNRANELIQLGVDRRWVMPPLHQCLWRIGIPVRPPLYFGSLLSTVVEGVILAGFWLLGMVVVFRQPIRIELVIASIVFGFLFSIFERSQFFHLRRRMQLPEWNKIRCRTELKTLAEQDAPSDGDNVRV
jgi:uncharacterized protein (DUF2062 family)